MTIEPEMLPIVVLLAAIFGYSNKMADMFNEHGLQWFRGDDLIYGLIFAGSGVALILLDGNLAAVYTAIVLAWFLFRKLDYRNHAIAGVSMIVGSFYVASTGHLAVGPVIAMTAAYLLLGAIKHRIRLKPPWVRTILRLRLPIYAVPSAFSIAVSDPVPILCTIAGMIPVEIVTSYYRRRGLE